jgi:hypothetical protein
VEERKMKGRMAKGRMMKGRKERQEAEAEEGGGGGHYLFEIFRHDGRFLAHGLKGTEGITVQ